MTTELRAKFQQAIETGEQIVKQYVGVDLILDEIETVYFVHVLISRNSNEVYCHVLHRGNPISPQWFEIEASDTLALSAVIRARA